MSNAALTWEAEQLISAAQDREWLENFQRLKYMNLAFLTLLLYDHVLTLNLEVTRIWSLPWKLPKYLFITNRYLLPPFLFFEGICESENTINGIELTSCQLTQFTTCPLHCTVKKWAAWPTMLSLLTVEVMLILRVLALYGNDRRMARFLILMFLLELVVWIIIACNLLVKIRGFPGGNVFSGCLFVSPPYLYAGWLPGVLFESLLIIITIHKTLKYNTFSPILKVLARDSVIYFVLVFGILLNNTLETRFGHRFLGPTLTLPSSVLACVGASRMTINIRRFTMDLDEAMVTAQNEIQSMLHLGTSRRREDTNIQVNTLLTRTRHPRSSSVIGGRDDSVDRVLHFDLTGSMELEIIVPRPELSEIL